jgi:radical SAM superfamily enzyme YgiQ (UPF0313 family)
MAEIILTTLNARYTHAAFGLRYLFANLGPLQTKAQILEFDINQGPVDIAEVLLATRPKLIGLGVYIWNVGRATELVAILKRTRPEITIILGGPEVSYEPEAHEIVRLADYLITGEADLKFAEVCGQLLAGDCPASKIIPAELPDVSRLCLPYTFYDQKDIAHRILYVEASRGCPFSCEFCLSSLEIPVRQFPLEPLLSALDTLLKRGARQLKFVDRTFNLNVKVGCQILEFLLERLRPGHFFHFEMVPDRLPGELREVIGRFPPGALQFEVGIQTFNESVATLISRRQDYKRLEDNLTWLRQHTGVHVHADLIAGLPGESLESFARGFDRLVKLEPHEIQVGILKRLRGTAIVRHDVEWAMVYNPYAPYEVLENRLIDFQTMQKLRRFARYWDLVANSGNFVETTPLIWESNAETVATTGCRSPFYAFLRLSEWLYAHGGKPEGIALVRLMELLFRFMRDETSLPAREIAEVLWRDYQRGGRRDKPEFLREFLPSSAPTGPPVNRPAGIPKRQSRHLERR